MTHPCNNPNLSPIEFLEAVMHDDTFSIALRAKAAKALTSIQTKAPVPPITIHIKYSLSVAERIRREGPRAGQHEFTVKIANSLG